MEGINVHRYGAHIFHTNNKAVWQYVNRFAEFNRYTNSPVANYHGEICNMPFNMNTFNKMWGVVTPAEAKAKIEEQKKEAGITDPQNLWKSRLSALWAPISTSSSRGYTGKAVGHVPAPSCPLLSSSACPSALPTTTTTSTRCIRASPMAAIHRYGGKKDAGRYRGAPERGLSGRPRC